MTKIMRITFDSDGENEFEAEELDEEDERSYHGCDVSDSKQIRGSSR